MYVFYKKYISYRHQEDEKLQRGKSAYARIKQLSFKKRITSEVSNKRSIMSDFWRSVSINKLPSSETDPSAAADCTSLT